MRETYTSDFPGMEHRENIRTGYIMTCAAARSDNQLSEFHNLSQVRVLHFSSCLLFCFLGWGWNYSEQRGSEELEAVSAAESGKSPVGRRAPVGLVCTPVTHFWGGDVHRCSTEGEPLPCLLSCSKVCCVASNASNTSTGILISGMPRGATLKVQTQSWKTHAHECNHQHWQNMQQLWLQLLETFLSMPTTAAKFANMPFSLCSCFHSNNTNSITCDRDIDRRSFMKFFNIARSHNSGKY